jgi:hypothetical protein
VIFTVNQVSPACREIGRLTVAGRAGLSRVRFADRVHGRSLSPGTYRIAARSSGSSSSLPEQQLPDPMSQAPRVSSGLGVTDGPNMHGGVLATSVAILLLSLAVAPARRARRAALELHACAPSCRSQGWVPAP